MNSIDPGDVSRCPKMIKDAQIDAVNLDVLICGKCHAAFHFVEDFQSHKDDGCVDDSKLRESFAIEPKSQVWGFLLWKNSKQKLEGNKNSWAMYQMWCKLEEHTRESWITAGKNVQFFSNIGLGKMQEFKCSTKNGDHDNYENTRARNDTNINLVKTNVKHNINVCTNNDIDNEDDANKIRMLGKRKWPTKTIDSATMRNDEHENDKFIIQNSSTPYGKRTRKNTGALEERNVENVIGKTWNQKKKHFEYLIKWEGLSSENNTWEPMENLETCKQLIEEYEKAQNKKQTNVATVSVAKTSSPQANTDVYLVREQKITPQAAVEKSLETVAVAEERPQRSSKKKAMNMVKAWCGDISDKDELEYKKKSADDSEELGRNKLMFESMSKKSKIDSFSDQDYEDPADGVDGADDDSEWSGGDEGASDDEKGISSLTTLGKKNKQKTSILEATILGKTKMPELNSTLNNVSMNARADLTQIHSANAKPSGMSISGANNISHTIAKGKISGIYSTVKKLPKTQSNKNREQVRVIQRGSRIRSGVFKVSNSVISSSPTTKPMAVNGIHSTNRYLTGSTALKQKSAMTLNTNRIYTSISGGASMTSTPIGVSSGISRIGSGRTATPLKYLPTNALTVSAKGTSGTVVTTTTTTAAVHKQQQQKSSTFPTSSISLSNTNININTSTPSSTNATANSSIFLNSEDNQTGTNLESFTDASGNLMLKDEDGTIYQVAGQDENGQTVLLAQDSNGEQQCLVLTTDENSKALEESVLAHNNAVAAAAAAASITADESGADKETLKLELTNDLQQQQQQQQQHITLVEGTVGDETHTQDEEQQLLQQIKMDDQQANESADADAAAHTNGNVNDAEAAIAGAQLILNSSVVEGAATEDAENGSVVAAEATADGEDPDSNVVAHVLKADPPSPGGTRKITLLLPDGNYMFADVNKEQYDSLGLDK